MAIVGKVVANIRISMVKVSICKGSLPYSPSNLVLHSLFSISMKMPASLPIQLLKSETWGHPWLFPLPWPLHNHQNLFGCFSDLSASLYLHSHFLTSRYMDNWLDGRLGGFLSGFPGSCPVHLCSVLHITAWVVIPKKKIWSLHSPAYAWSVSSHCLRFKSKFFSLVYETHHALVRPASPWRQRQ